MATSGFAKLGLSTDRTCVQFVSDRYGWYTDGIAMQIGDTPGEDMAKALVPEESKLVASQMIDDELSGSVDSRDRWR